MEPLATEQLHIGCFWEQTSVLKCKPEGKVCCRLVLCKPTNNYTLQMHLNKTIFFFILGCSIAECFSKSSACSDFFLGGGGLDNKTKDF